MATEKRVMNCIMCPMGCELTVTLEGGKFVSVTGNTCPRGAKYAEDEVTAPKRMLTSTVRIKGGFLPLLPVVSKTVMPKGKVLEAAQALRSLAFAWASVLRAASNARDAVPCWGCSNCGTRLAIAIRASRARFHANAAAATASSCAVCFIGFFRDSTAAEPLPHSCAGAAVPLGDSSAPAAIPAGRLSQAGHVSGGVDCDCLAAFQRLSCALHVLP